MQFLDTQANKIRTQLRNKEKQKISVVSRLCLIENEIDRYKLEDNCYKRLKNCHCCFLQQVYSIF